LARLLVRSLPLILGYSVNERQAELLRSMECEAAIMWGSGVIEGKKC